jgi:hypothetical protein
MKNTRGKRPLKRCEGSCRRRIKKSAHQAGCPEIRTRCGCPIGEELVKEMRRLAYAVRKGAVSARYVRAASDLVACAKSVSRVRPVMVPWPVSGFPKHDGRVARMPARKVRRGGLRRDPVPFVASGVLADPEPRPASPSPRPPFPAQVSDKSCELLPFDVRVKGTAFESPVLVRYRCAARKVFALRAYRRFHAMPFPERHYHWLEGTPLAGLPAVPPMGSSGYPVNLLYPDKPAPFGWLFREDLLDASLPVAPVSDFELPGLFRQAEESFEEAGWGAELMAIPGILGPL